MQGRILQICAIDLTMMNLLAPLVVRSFEEGYQVEGACSDTGYFKVFETWPCHIEEVKIDRSIHPVSNMRSIFHLYRLMRQRKYDIVHVHTPVASVLGRIAAKLAGVPHIVYTAHGFYFHDGMSRGQYLFWFFLEKFFARFCTTWILLQSREDYDLCIKHKFKRGNRILHLSNGVNIHTKFHPDCVSRDERCVAKQRWGIQSHDVVICFVGRLVQEKGIYELVKAFQILRDSTDASVKLLLIGHVSSSERDQGACDIEKRIGSNPGVILAGDRKDVPTCLAISDIFALPSYREGLPRSVIEAMAMGLPIVATNVRGCREQVREGDNGYLVPISDVNALYAKLHDLVCDSERRQQFGLKSRMFAEKYFDEEKVLDKQIKLFQQLIGGTKAKHEATI